MKKHILSDAISMLPILINIFLLFQDPNTHLLVKHLIIQFSYIINHNQRVKILGREKKEVGIQIKENPYACVKLRHVVEKPTTTFFLEVVSHDILSNTLKDVGKLLTLSTFPSIIYYIIIIIIIIIIILYYIIFQKLNGTLIYFTSFFAFYNNNNN